MNIDAKILNKQLNLRIYKKSSTMILEMQGWFNIEKSVNILHHINKLK